MIEPALATLLLLMALALARNALRDPASVTLCEIAYVAVGLFFGAGYWLAALYEKGSASRPLDAELASWVYAAPALHLIGLWTATRFLGPGRPVLALVRGHESCLRAVVVAAFLAAWAFRVTQVAVYDVLPSLDNPEDDFAPPYVYMVALTLTSFLIHGCLLWAAIALFSRRMSARLLPALILVTEILWRTVTSRRDAMLWMLFVLLGVLASRPRLRAGLIASGVAGGLILTQLVLPWIPAMRSAYRRDEGVIAAMSEVLRCGLESFRAEESENLTSRPLNLRTFLADIVVAQLAHEPMNGRALMRSLSFAIPSVFWPSKEHSLHTELAIQEHHGLPLIDTAISWPAVAVADFGIAGCLPYGLLLGVLLAALQGLVPRVAQASPFLALALLANMVYFVFHVEQDPITVWVMLRSFALLAGPALLWQRLRPRGAA